MITLTFPPSLNNSKTPVNGRQVSSSRYRQWKAANVRSIFYQRPPKIAGPFRITLVVTRPDMRRRDLDNLVKPCLDALVKAEVVEDDYLADEIVIRWSKDRPDKVGGVSISLEAVA